MTTTEILNSQRTKTDKIRLLLELGLTRKEVANILNIGYGFVQNVFAKTYPDRIQSRRVVIGDSMSFIFNRNFGVEIEAYGISRATLAKELRREGINVAVEGYNHDTREHWKLVTDGSLRGENTFELVSPILKGEEGLEELKKVCKVLKAKGAKVNKTCGLHIHFDATDYNLDNWKNIYQNLITRNY